MIYSINEDVLRYIIKESILEETLEEVKKVGNGYYMNKAQADAHKSIPEDVYNKSVELLKQQYPDFDFTHIMYDPKVGKVRFDRSEDFDTCTEPEVSDAYDVFYDNDEVKPGKHSGVWHHRQWWVDDDYKGFDMDKNKAWTDAYEEAIKKHQVIPKEIHQLKGKGNMTLKTPNGGSRPTWLMHLMFLDKMEGNGPTLIDRYMSENGISDPIEYLSKYDKEKGNYTGRLVQLYNELHNS